jgi:hypothetical protein
MPGKAGSSGLLLLCVSFFKHDLSDGYFPSCYSCRECQRADWKPRHKAVCGKPLTLADCESSAGPKTKLTKPDYQYPWEDPELRMEKIGPALDNYKRSPALAYQIYAIHKLEYPMLDYIFFLPSDDIYPFVISDIVTKYHFRQCREEAMTTGNRTAIAILGEFLSYMQPKSTAGPTRQNIMKQLSNEFGFDVNAAVSELDKERANDPQGLTTLERERERILVVE